MNRTIKGGIALAGVLALGTACAAEPESGIVTEKEYEEAYSITTQNCTNRYDSKGRYVGQSCYPSTQYYPECFEIDYESQDPEAERTEGEDCVSEALYNALEVGDEYHKGMGVSDVS
jgi:hypothetical protein